MDKSFNRVIEIGCIAFIGLTFKYYSNEKKYFEKYIRYYYKLYRGLNRENIKNDIEKYCKDGSLFKIKCLINLGVNNHNIDYYKFLTIAIENNHLSVVKYLVNELVKIDTSIIIENVYINIIYVAIKHNHLEIIKYFIEIGNDPIYKIKRLNKAVMSATCRNNIALVEYFGNQGADFDFTEDYNYILAIACRNENLEILKYLINKGVDPTVGNNYILLNACRYDNLEIVKYLISQGADPFDRNNEALIEACRYNNLNIVKYLISIGVDVSAQDNMPISLLLLDRECAEYLISYGADPNYLRSNLRELFKKEIDERNIIKDAHMKCMERINGYPKSEKVQTENKEKYDEYLKFISLKNSNRIECNVTG